ncbi:hypothetical protein CEW46_21210 [Bacillus cereus]|nr:hypothetical protein CEW46_21210 [Bacillus cereus]
MFFKATVLQPTSGRLTTLKVSIDLGFDLWFNDVSLILDRDMLATTDTLKVGQSIIIKVRELDYQAGLFYLDELIDDKSFLYNYPVKEVLRVVDGDTLKVELDLGINKLTHRTTLRLANIDAYELKDPNGKGLEAKEFIESLIKDCKSDHIRVDITHYDKYRRSLAFVYIKGQQLNTLLLENGYCK